MSKEEAINILIGLAVCISPELHCDDDCPFFEKEGNCKYVEAERDFELVEAVKKLKEKERWVNK